MGRKYGGFPMKHLGIKLFGLVMVAVILLFLVVSHGPIPGVQGAISDPLYWIYEQSIQGFIRQDAFYLEIADGKDGDKVFANLQKQGVISSYEQPFTALDIPYYRVEFSTREDMAKRIVASLVANQTVKKIEGIPIFEIQQFSYSGSTTRPLNKLNRKPVKFSTQSIREPDFEWQWYLDEIGMIPKQLMCANTDNPKIKVAIIDNAFMVNHVNLKGSIQGQYDIADKDQNTLPPLLESEWMHGTHSAGLLAGRKSHGEGIMGSALGSSEVFVLKATSDTAGATEITHGIEAFAKAIEMNVDVISLSWGAYMDFPVFRQVVKKAIDKGIVVIAAAGNYGSEDRFFPASYPGVIAVGAYDKSGAIADFSNFGDRVDVYAPGVDLVAPVNTNEYASTDGTSSAAPLFAGGYAFLMRYFGNDIDQLKKLGMKENNTLGRTFQLSNLCDLKQEEVVVQELNEPTGGVVPEPLPEKENTLVPEIDTTHNAAPAPEPWWNNFIRIAQKWGGWIVAGILGLVVFILGFFKKKIASPEQNL